MSTTSKLPKLADYPDPAFRFITELTPPLRDRAIMMVNSAIEAMIAWDCDCPPWIDCKHGDTSKVEKWSLRHQKLLGADDATLMVVLSALAVFELAEVTNTRATLRTTELFLSEIMLWARQNRKARRILIVLEEAHTIIPETAGAGFDYDTQWVVGRIGQIALQGRKYGVGLLIVSQRTALVSKTILSQCNTYFTHALVDQTSLNYLSNVYSDEHVKAIPNLRFLEFFAYGRAVRSERPLLVHREFDEAKAAASRSLDSPSQAAPEGG